VDRKLKEFNNMQMIQIGTHHTFHGKTIAWGEKLLVIPIEDYRKNPVSLTLTPYLRAASNIINSWLSRCVELRQLDQNFDYTVRYALKYSQRMGIDH
jgi:hypothetical protein